MQGKDVVGKSERTSTPKGRSAMGDEDQVIIARLLRVIHKSRKMKINKTYDHFFSLFFPSFIHTFNMVDLSMWLV